MTGHRASDGEVAGLARLPKKSLTAQQRSFFIVLGAHMASDLLVPVEDALKELAHRIFYSIKKKENDNLALQEPSSHNFL